MALSFLCTLVVVHIGPIHPRLSVRDHSNLFFGLSTDIHVSGADGVLSMGKTLVGTLMMPLRKQLLPRI
jgi:hypothetical protein